MRGKKILIIDDDEAMLTMLEEYFSDLGLFVHVYRSAAKVVSELSAQDLSEIEVIITDVHMPSMGGLEFLDWLQSQRKVPAILISAFGSQELEAQALGRGAHSFIKKPFSLYDLKKAVESALLQSAS